jgi:hypothetical protein
MTEKRFQPERKNGLTTRFKNVSGKLSQKNNMKTLFFSVLLATGLMVGFVRADPFTVTSANDSGDNSHPGMGTLRWAIIKANNATSENNLINFNIPVPGGGPALIQPLSLLPAITRPVVIDGTTQPGYAGVPLIDINGGQALPGTDGLIIAANGCEIYGLAINGFQSTVGYAASAVKVVESGGLIIRSNYLGLTASGLVPPLTIELIGLNLLDSWGSDIGGPGSSRNVISGNSVFGVFINGISSSNNVIEGNFIGTDINGTSAKPNGFGIVINLGSSNCIGGSALGSGNVISGNASNAIAIITSCGNLVQSNYIGTDKTGNSGVPNANAGVEVADGTSNTIAGNVISGNDGCGVLFDDQNLPVGIQIAGTPLIIKNLISGNLIGVGINGTALGNGHHGIAMWTYSHHNVAESNTIAWNGQDGVFLSGMYDYIGAANHIHNNVHNGVTVVTNAAFPGPGTFESIRSNSIYMNGVLGIDLGNDGRTPNDPCDDDYGANQLQNFPVLAGASHNADGVTIQGTFDSDIDAGYALDFFWNVQCSQIYSCSTCLNQYFIGSITLTPIPCMDTPFNVFFPVQVPECPGSYNFITATATSLFGDTSEFSDCCQLMEVLPTRVSLRAQFSGGNIIVSFPDCTRCTLQSSPTISPPDWVTVPPPYNCDGDECSVTLLMREHVAMFFRLSCP